MSRAIDEQLMKAIEIERLFLRDLVMSDKHAVHEYASNPEVVRFMDWGPNTEDETVEFIAKSISTQNEKPRRNFDFAIVLKDTGKLIGGCGIHVSNPENREGWLGYCLNRNYWGKGYATETGRGLIKFGFEKLNLHRLFAACDPENLASAHVLEKSGMKREGHLREHRWSKGKWRDSYLYAILEQDWK
jgi:RimJ/RimL family protein N-acetyltransferase